MAIRIFKQKIMHHDISLKFKRAQENHAFPPKKKNPLLKIPFSGSMWNGTNGMYFWALPISLKNTDFFWPKSCVKKLRSWMGHVTKIHRRFLGGDANPSEKYWAIWIISPWFGVIWNHHLVFFPKKQSNQDAIFPSSETLSEASKAANGRSPGCFDNVMITWQKTTAGQKSTGSKQATIVCFDVLMSCRRNGSETPLPKVHQNQNL